MQWIKAHLNVVIAGTVSLLALVGLILGVLLPDVAAPLNQDASLLSSLQNPQGAPRGALEQLRNQQLEHREKLAKELQKYAEQGNHEPLPATKDLFPKENPSAQSAPFEFKREFDAAQKALLAMLKAQGPPTEAEIAAEADNIIRRHAQAQLEKSNPAERPKAVGNVVVPGVMGGAGLMPATPGGTPTALPQLSANPTAEERVQKVPAARAAVNKARRLWCYATQANLDQRPAITEVPRPTLEDMWYAQMSLWVQQDILGALHRVNEKRAAELAEKDRWVGNMPFKRLLAFIVGGYVPKVEPTMPGRGAPSNPNQDAFSGPPPMDSSVVMSKHGTTDTVDVVQFTIEMIVEAQSLPVIINEISNCGFYTVLQVSYEAVPPNLELVDYIYGSKPVIKVWMLVEGSFLRTNKKYEALMPDTVKEAIKLGRPVGGGGAPGSIAPTPMLRGGGGRRGVDEFAP
ncbi:MAG TPA: hypothetical protein PK184_04780 [Phycisphaerae bacterium]|jgi:hypothetical protein|nr:hypothetical protein [Phycisphaerae bacterium]HQA45719.1 hypothetical protein [Phycisphaerae bacterium]